MHLSKESSSSPRPCTPLQNNASQTQASKCSRKLIKGNLTVLKYADLGCLCCSLRHLEFRAKYLAQHACLICLIICHQVARPRAVEAAKYGSWHSAYDHRNCSDRHQCHHPSKARGQESQDNPTLSLTRCVHCVWAVCYQEAVVYTQGLKN